MADSEKPSISLEGRRFGAVDNTGTGEVSDQTIFHYHHKQDLIWATYAGGSIRFGTLTGLMLPDGSLDFRYNHVNMKNEMMTGQCRSTIEILTDGRVRFHERWQWTSGDKSSGTSIIEELRY
ncbi:expressed unknown protein [Seminavis robusta]|uniref:N-acetylglutamate synthase n=1 Tax=Seminavis robusta TaxID=568900 RepID=A0A9N8D5E9_9STRA|nr:expressed unknown protein [Seminavis robusta]|eukprot:Sro9_g006980.1 n/a (122) ;mRNA; r:6527-6892